MVYSVFEVVMVLGELIFLQFCEVVDGIDMGIFFVFVFRVEV